MIEDQYNEIMTMNERSTHATLESNVRQRHNGERSLKHEVEKLHNFSKESYK